MPTERRGNNCGDTEDAASEGCCDEAFVLVVVVLAQTLSWSWSWYAAPKRSSFIRGKLVATELAKLFSVCLYCNTYNKAVPVGGGDSVGHVLRESTSRGL